MRNSTKTTKKAAKAAQTKGGSRIARNAAKAKATAAAIEQVQNAGGIAEAAIEILSAPAAPVAEPIDTLVIETGDRKSANQVQDALKAAGIAATVGRERGANQVYVSAKDFTAAQAVVAEFTKALLAEQPDPGKAERRAAMKQASADKKSRKAAKAAKKEAPAKKADGALEIHVNKTGRICFGRAAAARIGDMKFMAASAEGKVMRFVAKPKQTEGDLPIRRAAGNRPYLSATKLLKEYGFTGERAHDAVAKPYNTHGFEFAL
jgi:hypothetical protein